MKKFALVLALLASCGGWSKKDAALELGLMPAVAADWTQTEWITAHCQEGNPLIGACGQNVSLGWYFPATLAVHALVSAALPQGWLRTTWQAFTLGVEVKAVQRNSADGVRFWP